MNRPKKAPRREPEGQKGKNARPTLPRHHSRSIPECVFCGSDARYGTGFASFNPVRRLCEQCTDLHERARFNENLHELWNRVLRTLREGRS